MGGDSLAKYETALKTGGGRERGVCVGEGGTVLFSPFFAQSAYRPFPNFFKIRLKSEKESGRLLFFHLRLPPSFLRPGAEILQTLCKVF